jgi:hypothetical protein
MCKILTCALVLAVPLLTSPSRAEDRAGTLEPGSYVVDSILELPHLEGLGAKRTEVICIARNAASPTLGLNVLSENNPLAKCPSSNVRQDGSILTFDIKCDGQNSAVGSARYELDGQQFSGTIAMKMGGKNMTMTEIQRGRRVGPCEGLASPRS